ncbi:MAG TPA: hydantoinase/oxoprolinase family protein [Candidatus Nitrosotalea sp.]|nr:hydantoinase/oxoprolinase family protein [Candidatus Nitrosotalea sp.]
MNSVERRIRIGIDVGGTFTKAVAIDVFTGKIIAKSTVSTTHNDKTGVSRGIVHSLQNMMSSSEIQIKEIELIAHSTTQAINALLESDTAKVGIIGMGVGPEKQNVVKRTNLQDSRINSHNDLNTVYEFLDTSHLITETEVQNTITHLKNKGAETIVATEAFSVDDPSNELFVMRIANGLQLPSTASHEISGIYGLEIRTLTTAINASVLPKTVQVTDFVEKAIREIGISAPLMIMKGDGGVTDMNTFRTKPILTILSGPAASVAGALVYLKVTNGIFVEVGGTSTNVCIIRNGKPEIGYVTIKDHPTCIRSMDVRVLGIAGGSMVRLKNNRIWKVGPRSAHIAGLKYACFADPEDLKTGEIILIKPKSNDEEDYVAIKCKDGTYAITNTCAANALEMIEPGDYAYAGKTSAKIALSLLAQKVGGSSMAESALSIIQTSSFEITKTITKILKEFKMENAKTVIIGGGGGASVLVPFMSKQLGIQYKKADHAEVISSIGVASSMIKEEIEQTMHNPTKEQISNLHKKIHVMIVEKGAVPESVVINSEYIPEKSILRITAMGNVEYDNISNAKNVFTLDEAIARASEIMNVSKNLIELSFETDNHFVFTGHVEQKKFLVTKKRRHILVLDRYGGMKLSIENGKLLHGGILSVLEEFEDFMSSKHNGIAPQVHLIADLKLIDYSGLVSSSNIVNAIKSELEGLSKGAIIVEL